VTYRPIKYFFPLQSRMSFRSIVSIVSSWQSS